MLRGKEGYGALWGDCRELIHLRERSHASISRVGLDVISTELRWDTGEMSREETRESET